MTEQNYNECVTKYADNVFRFIIKNLGHEEDSKDVVQFAFEKLWLHRHEVENEKSKSYLFTVAYNTMISHIRKSKRMVYRDFAENEGGFTTSEPSNSARLLQEALGTLGETQRSLVMLKDYEGYNYVEIGEITGLNESQVKVYLHRARLALRNYIVKAENII